MLEDYHSQLKMNFDLDYVFLKRYKPNERSHMSVHTDINFFTVNVLLFFGINVLEVLNERVSFRLLQLF